MKNLNIKIVTRKNIRYGEMTNRVTETYKCYVMPHGKYIFNTQYAMDMETMCAYPLSKYAFTILEIYFAEF